MTKTMKALGFIFFMSGAMLFSGCSSKQPKSWSAEYLEIDKEITPDDGFIYNRTKNLEYMDVKSIEKIKRALSILIDKAEALEKNVYTKKEVEKIVNAKTGELSKTLNEIQSNPQKYPSATHLKDSNTTYSNDDEKILQFIQKD